MSSSEVEEVEDLLTYSGSEYEPSSSGEDSDVSSLEPSDPDSGDDGAGKKKRKRTRDPNKRRAKMQCNNRASSLPTGSIQFKPFREFMVGVTFAMSGFVNPLRSELRRKAIEMGARYKPDWDPTCTHLICAFKNTPKYNQVKGKGKIVKKEWIENSYLSRKRFPWRRYALNWRDINKNESEDEVHEMILTNANDAPDTPSDSLINSTTSTLIDDSYPLNCESPSNENTENDVIGISSTDDVCPDTSLNSTENCVTKTVELTESDVVSSSNCESDISK